MSRRAAGALALLGACCFALAAGWIVHHSRQRGEQRATELRARRDQLRLELERLRLADPTFRSVPDADVVIGLPAATLARLLEETLAGVLRQVEIGLSDIRVARQDVVRAKTFLGSVTPGEYEFELRLDQVRAILEPGRPSTRLGGQRVDLTVPVSLAEGFGSGRLRFRWISRGVAGAICADFEANEGVAGRVRPRSYTVRGAFDVASEGGTLVARPSFADVKLRIHVEPSRASWGALERLIAERPAQCRAALKLIDVTGAVKGLLSDGFEVRLPGRVVKPIKLPARVEQSLFVEGRRYVLAATSPRVVAAPEQLWFGVCVEARRE